MNPFPYMRWNSIARCVDIRRNLVKIFPEILHQFPSYSFNGIGNGRNLFFGARIGRVVEMAAEMNDLAMFELFSGQLQKPQRGLRF